MSTNVERALQKMTVMGYKVYPMNGFYLVEDRVVGFKLVMEKNEEVVVSPIFDKVQRLGSSKVIVYKTGRYGIFDTVTWKESTYYHGLEVREFYNGKVYLVYKLDGFYGVIDEDDNEIIPNRYTFINFINMGENPPIIVGVKVNYGEYGENTQVDELFNIKGEYLPVSRVIRGRTYVLLGETVYAKEGQVVKLYNLKGEVIRNGGKR